MSLQTTIALNRLVASTTNVRETAASPGPVKSMADAIRAKDLLRNLIPRPAGDEICSVEGRERRHEALVVLAESNDILANFPVPCLELEAGDDPVEISLAENVVRNQMHPADEFEPYARMLADGRSTAEISSRFGVTEAVVRQRMKLVAVSPKLIEAYRREDLTLECLTAFTVTGGHAAQERMFAETATWSRSPHTIRAQLTRGAVSSDDRLAIFARVDVYEQAGGPVTRDLFSDAAFLEDRSLLETLADRRLSEKAEELRAQGWSWVETRRNVGWQDLQGFDRLPGETIARTVEEAAEVETTHARIAAFEERDADELSEEEEARWDALEEKLEDLNTPRLCFTPEQKAESGAMIGIGFRGGFDIHLGLTRKKARNAAGIAADEPREIAAKPLSAALIEKLSAQRTAALAIKLARNPRVALVGVLHKLLLDTGFVLDSGSCLDLHASPVFLNASIAEPDDCQALTALDQASLPLQEQLPGDAAELWHWLLEQSTEKLLELLAHASARCVNAVTKSHDGGLGGRASHADLLAETLCLNMRQWWRPSAQNYISRTPKAHIEQVVRDALGDEPAETLCAMKKREAAAEAERLLAGTDWLPSQLAGAEVRMTKTSGAFQITGE